MAIYKLSDYDDSEPQKEAPKPIQEPSSEPQGSFKDRFLSSCTARLFFFFLFAVDAIWAAYSLTMGLVYMTLHLLTLCRFPLLKKKRSRTFLSLKRALVCGVALFVAIFSPALGIMFACSYFLMYDKEGIEEVVPASLRDQFREFTP